MARYNLKLVKNDLIPEMESNCMQFGVESQVALNCFQKNKFAENIMYFHHSYACYDIPIGQEYEIAAHIKGRQINSVEICKTKILCFFSAYRTRPTAHALCGYHEFSLIQFQNVIPSIIYELYEVSERKPIDIQQKIYLCSKDTLRLQEAR